VNPVKTATVLTHRRPAETRPALTTLRQMAQEAGAVLRLDRDETEKHELEPADGMELDADVRSDVDICFALGGDGTVLTALRAYAGTGVPVFGVNYGEIGFLATVDRDEARPGFERAFAGDFETLSLPGIGVSSADGSGGGEPAGRRGEWLATDDETGRRGEWLAINDVSMHRQPGKRVADLEYGVGADDIGRVRCDGLVVATPAGSTGYNLANGGPVMAWGVEGFVVSFIAPHSLTARALVVAPGDVLLVHNRSRDESVDVTVDGRPVCVLPPNEHLEARFVHDQGCLAQVPGTTFYERLREKFGRLASMP
jgi:NAD+ kinase